MNWMLRFRRLLGRFWHDIFEDAEFLLGVEYLHSLYAKLIENQYLNWRNGMIAKDTSVEQDMQPVVVYLQADTTREWYPLEKIFAPTDEGRASAYSFANNAMAAGDTNTGGWLTDSKDPVPDPVYMLDHVYGYTKMLVKGLDYDVQDSHFLFYVDPATLGLPVVKMLDKDGLPHRYYKLFGYPRRESKVCDPVTGFESSWLNPFSDIVWDIHQNGATFYNMKQLLGKATDSVICEKAGDIDGTWTEQDWNCLSVDGKVYMSKYPANVSSGHVEQGDVLFGSLRVWRGTDSPTADQIPGIRVQTDAGELVAMNQDDMEPYDVDGLLVLPLTGVTDDALTVENYKIICGINSGDARCPYIQVPTAVNPYKFIMRTLRRGRSVAIRLVATELNTLAAALACLRKSTCASGLMNVYVADENDPQLSASLAEDELGLVIDPTDSATLRVSCFAADAGMMAVTAVESLAIHKECAEAKVLL